MAGLSKEIWISQIMENFIPNNDFLNDGFNANEWVSNDFINIPVSGTRPSAIFNPTLPLTITTRTDTNNSVAMHDIATQPTRVTRPEDIELSYSKMESVISGHRQSLVEMIGNRAIFEIAPPANSAQLPVIAATGTAAAGNPRPITRTDILQMASLFDQLDYPRGRTIVMTPFQFYEFLNENPEIQKTYSFFEGNKTGVYFEIYGFKVRMRSVTANYTQTLTIQAFMTNNAASRQAAICYCDNEWFYGFSNAELLQSTQPEWLGTVFNFYQRAGAGRFAQRCVGAIVSVNA